MRQWPDLIKTLTVEAMQTFFLKRHFCSNCFMHVTCLPSIIIFKQGKKVFKSYCRPMLSLLSLYNAPRAQQSKLIATREIKLQCSFVNCLRWSAVKIWESTEQYTMQELYGLNQRAKSNQNYLEKLGKSFATIGQFPLLCRDKRHNTGRFLFQTTQESGLALSSW